MSKFLLLIACLLIILLPETSHSGESGHRRKSYQKQGQFQIQGQQSKQKNSQNLFIEEGEENITTAVWPTTPSTHGKEEKSIYSLFGGIGSNKTEEHLKIEHQYRILETMKMAGLVEEEDYQAEAKKLYKQLQRSNRPPKLLGIIPFAGRGCNFLNICGLAAW